MTPNEVGGLQALAKAQGGSLTRNPETGLYEAGFLSTVLPMVAGVAASAFLGPEMLPLVAGGIGLADYAMTGSLTQGLMAGLGAWSGGSLAEGLGNAGAADLAEQGANASEETFKASQAKALEAAGGDEVNRLSAQEIAKNQISNSALNEAQKDVFQQAVQNSAPDQLSNIMRGAGAAAVNPTIGQGMVQGAGSLADIGSALSANKMAAAGVALPLVSGALFKQPTVNAPASSVTTVNQPLQRLSPDYKGSVITTPTDHYQAAYPNYVQTPYNPYTGTPAVQSPASTIYAADGGLMASPPTPGLMDNGRAGNVDFMGGDMYPQSQIQRSYYATPTQAPTSAQQVMASYEPKTNPLTGEPTAHMAEGGIAGLASGGQAAGGDFKPTNGYLSNAIVGLQNSATPNMLSSGTMQGHVYQPSYVNYAQTPYNPSTAPVYGAIPTPTRAPMGNTQTPGIAGYALDPLKMQGSPAYNAEQARIAAEQAAAQQALGGPYNPSNIDYAGGGLTAFAEGSKKPVGNKDMVAIDDYTEQAQSGGIASVKNAADSGDWNAQLALQKLGYKAGGGGISDLGSYSDGGRLLKGPGDGVSDDIPAQIGKHQPARLADGEFVVPARIVSELGNGSTDAGAKRLYAMMERVQSKRKKSMGKGKFAVNSKAEKDLPA
jgi:hypothetical protein